jgi:hypothetical protein
MLGRTLPEAVETLMGRYPPLTTASRRSARAAPPSPRKRGERKNLLFPLKLLHWRRRFYAFGVRRTMTTPCDGTLEP